jgi:hypothetical protein
MTLSTLQLNDLSRAWFVPLRDCSDPRLEKWYLDQLDAAVRRGQFEEVRPLRTAIYDAATPGIRTYLRTRMLDPNVPEPARSEAGGQYFSTLQNHEQMLEFFHYFETGAVPEFVGLSMAERFLGQQPERFAAEMARRVRANPTLAEHLAFMLIVEDGRRRVSDGARRALADALESGLDSAPAGLTAERRARLAYVAHFLRRGPK